MGAGASRFGAVMAIAGTALRRMFRERINLFFVLLLPVVIILVVGLAIGTADHLPVAVSGREDGPLARELAESLERRDGFEIDDFDDRDDVERAVRRSEVVVGVTIPPGYDARVAAGEHVTVGFVTSPEFAAPGGIRSAVEAAVAEQSAPIEAARFAAAQSGGTLDDHIASARSLAEDLPRVSIAQTVIEGGDEIPLGFGYTAPSNLVLFMFITSLAAASQVIESRRLGISRRMLATPASAGVIVAGEALARYLIALFQGLFVLGAGAFVFGVDWGDPFGALALVAVFALVGAGAALLVGTLFDTPQVVGAVGPMVGIGLGMLGGCMWPLEIVGPAMRAVGHLTPHAWAMDGFIDLVGEGAGVGDILVPLAVLGGFAVVLLPFSAWRLRHAIVG